MYNYNVINKLIDNKQQEKKSITVGEMASSMGLSLASLNNIKFGINIPKADTLEIIAKYFGVDMNYFFDSFDQIKSNIVSTPPAEFHKPEDNYKALYEMQKEINEIIKDNADLRVENERLKNVTAPTNGAKTG